MLLLDFVFWPGIARLWLKRLLQALSRLCFGNNIVQAYHFSDVAMGWFFCGAEYKICDGKHHVEVILWRLVMHEVVVSQKSKEASARPKDPLGHMHLRVDEVPCAVVGEAAQAKNDG